MRSFFIVQTRLRSMHVVIVFFDAEDLFALETSALIVDSTYDAFSHEVFYLNPPLIALN